MSFQEKSQIMSRMDRLVAACDYLRNPVPTSGNQTPLIEENPIPGNILALAAILAATHGDKFTDDVFYEKFLSEEREKIAKKEHDELVSAARLHVLFHVPERGDQTPAILINPSPPGVAAMAAILAVSEPYDPYSIWSPFTEEELEEGATRFWADLFNVGTFDKTIGIDSHAHKMFENRPLTRTELVLAMKCDYVAKHRGWALHMRFKFDPNGLIRTFRRRCGIKEDPCVCSHIEPNHMYS